jgi:hypothetical protein
MSNVRHEDSIICDIRLVLAQSSNSLLLALPWPWYYTIPIVIVFCPLFPASAEKAFSDAPFDFCINLAAETKYGQSEEVV